MAAGTGVKKIYHNLGKGLLVIKKYFCLDKKNYNPILDYTKAVRGCSPPLEPRRYISFRERRPCPKYGEVHFYGFSMKIVSCALEIVIPIVKV